VKIADRFIFLKGGMIIFDGEREKLLHAPVPEIQTFIQELNPKP
jgi:ABC-type transporter Mla maintaining outer membrane lipid asymmetry ATPase subunit MlaF